MMPTFSIIIPTYNRADGRLQRALDSVVCQVYRAGDWECVVVDDGSTDDTNIIESWFEPIQYSNFNIIHHEQRQGRVIARNTGMAAATGEWIAWLDSDDAYDPMYLATFAHHIEQEPDARLFVCGAIVHGMVGERNARICPAWTKIRKAWMPPVNSDGAHLHFTSGKIGTGSFVFHRECYEAVGPFPPWVSHLDIADGVDEWLGYETGYSAAKKWVGNPYGDDWAYLRKLTMLYRVHLVHPALYVQYMR
jgi:glycosyltransferase involved in cell wall biosynthesis